MFFRLLPMEVEVWEQGLLPSCVWISKSHR